MTATARPVHVVAGRSTREALAHDVTGPAGRNPTAPELLTFLDAAHRRIAELEDELAALRRRHGDPPGRTETRPRRRD